MQFNSIFRYSVIFINITADQLERRVFPNLELHHLPHSYLEFHLGV